MCTIATAKAAGADFLTAGTFNRIDEAVGIVRADRAHLEQIAENVLAVKAAV